MRFYRRPYVACARDLQSRTVFFGVRDELAEANTQDKIGYYQVRAYLEIFPTTTYAYSYLDFIPTCGRLDECKSGVCGVGLNRNMK